MALKIIHCADIHLDSAMSGIKDLKKVNIRREDMKKTFKKQKSNFHKYTDNENFCSDTPMGC